MTEADFDERALMCVAHGCPRRWPVSHGIGAGATGMCSAHAWADRHEWPAITERIRMGELTPGLKPQEVPENAGKALMAIPTKDRHDWARRLQWREESGEKLSDTQRKLWRAVLGPIGEHKEGETE